MNRCNAVVFKSAWVGVAVVLMTLAWPNKAKAAAKETVDLLVVYTQTAVDGEGGEAALLAKIDQEVYETNEAFRNSQIGIQIRLVQKVKVDYADSGNLRTDLQYLTGTRDGEMDHVHVLRDKFGADMVSLIVYKGYYGGYAWVNNRDPENFGSHAFSVCRSGMLNGYDLLAHELGHNLGCDHDWENAGHHGLTSYAYGHRFVGDSGTLWATVMAYYPGARAPFFSAPEILHDGKPTGTASRNNAKVVRYTVQHAKHWRKDPATFFELKAQAGVDQKKTDTNDDKQEIFTVDGSASKGNPAIVSYKWSWEEVDKDGKKTAKVALGKTASLTLPVGRHMVKLEITNIWGDVASDELALTVNPKPLTKLERMRIYNELVAKRKLEKMRKLREAKQERMRKYNEMIQKRKQERLRKQREARLARIKAYNKRVAQEKQRRMRAYNLKIQKEKEARLAKLRQEKFERMKKYNEMIARKKLERMRLAGLQRKK